ncbi:MAG TPA: hypothetical protein VNL18_06435 [Gemmatimonadales bacterium]|nr:hypothetical protein [Gemmatimonadales bacterium]
MTLSDHLGRIPAERVSSESRDVLHVGDVPLGPGHTPYSLAGDWFGATSVVLTLTMVVIATRRARRP